MEYEKKRKDYHNKQRKEFFINLKKEVFKQYGGKCVFCGQDKFEYLSIEHINNDGKKHREELKKLEGNINIYRWLKKNNFPKDRFQILCFNCNMAKQFYDINPIKGVKI